MSAASPTPMGGGSHFTSLGRRTSARQALRRPSSRPQISRSESNPVGGPAPSTSATRESRSQAQSQSQSQPQSQQYVTLNDSSDDEFPVPMKLSALTKALLNDGHGAERSPVGRDLPSAQERPVSPPPRPASRVRTRRSVLAASTSSSSEDRDLGREGVKTRDTRRQTRTSSQAPSPRQSSPVRSRENSPAPRKRVVRLSNSGVGNVSLQHGLRRSLSTSAPRKQPETRERSEEKSAQPPPQLEQQPRQDVPLDINTPVLPVRTVRIALGSSGKKTRSGGSSGPSSKRSGEYDEHEVLEDPATVGRPQTVAPQSSMRVKRVGKMGGSFLSGPARRGRRRQSEEDEEAHEEGEGYAFSQERENRQSHYAEPELGEQPASSFLASNYRDFAASGSPVSASARDSARAGISRRLGSNPNSSGGSSGSHKEAERSHLELVYRIPAPPSGEAPAHDKENEAPPTFKRTKPSSALVIDKELDKPARPLAVDTKPQVEARPASPERKVLAQKSQNTPLRAAPPPPPKMSVVETATAAAGAASQANKKRQVLLRVNGRTYTRIDCIGRGGSGKVYRVSAESGKMLALKRVSLEHADENTVKGFKGEIDLLKRLHGVDRVIQLIDHELNLEKQMLSVVRVSLTTPNLVFLLGSKN